MLSLLHKGLRESKQKKKAHRVSETQDIEESRRHQDGGLQGEGHLAAMRSIPQNTLGGEKMRKTGVVLLAAALVLIWAQAAFADEISDTIERGKELYQEGKYSEASSELQFAVGQIQNVQAEQLKQLLPAPLPGWTAEEASASAAAMGLFGGGVTASRVYRKEGADEYIEIEILSESPLLQTVLMFLTNPMMASAQPDTKLVRIKGEKGLEKFSAQDEDGELSVVLDGKTLLTVRGSRITDKDILYEYMEAIDFGQVRKALAG